MSRPGAAAGRSRPYVVVAAVIVVETLLVAGFATAWAISLVPYSADWGTVADWVTATAAVAALVGVGLQIGQWNAQQRQRLEDDKRRERELDDERQREREALGMAVGARLEIRFDNEIGSHVVRWTVSNASPFPITEVALVMGGQDGAAQRSVGSVLPMASETGTWVLGTAAPDPGFTVRYVDSWRVNREIAVSAYTEHDRHLGSARN